MSCGLIRVTSELSIISTQLLMKTSPPWKKNSSARLVKMESSNHFKKFKLLLEYALEGKIVINEFNADKLLRILEDHRENNPGKLLLDTPSFSDLIFKSLANMNNASTSVQIFIVKIVTIIFRDEVKFTKMQIQCFQNAPLNFCIFNNLNSICPPDLHLACIELLTTQMTHASGFQSLLQHKVWKSILYPNIHNRPIQISTAAYNFVAKIVWKIHELNLEMELLEVLGYIVEPILASEFINVPVIDAETDRVFTDKIFAHMSAFLAVLTEVDNYAPDNSVIYLIKHYFIIDQKIFEIFKATKNLRLLKLLNPTLFRYFYGVLRHLLFDNEIDDFCNKMAAFIRNYVVYATQKREPLAIIDFVVQSNIIWSGIEKLYATKFNFPLTFERNGKQIDFSLQIIIHLVVPMMKIYLMRQNSNIGTIEQFTVKLSKYLTEYIYSCCYVFSDSLEEAGPNVRMEVATHSLKQVLRLKGHLNKSQSGTLYQTLHYLLEIFISCDEGELVLKESPLDPEDLRLLSHLLNALKMLLKEYQISWYENVEIVCIQANLLNLLKQKFLTTKHVVQVLDLLDICMQKFISPNMSLLVDIKCTQSNTLDETGRVISFYTQHDDWDVRDSAFNLLNSCIEISFIKYIHLQKVIKEKNLIILAANAALKDPEYYSQCTALKCLAAATKINSIWQDVLIDNANIYFHLKFILRNHAEGMVRTEAANVLTAVYKNQKVTPRLQSILYEVMMTAALDDLHWEVQLAALSFWKQSIHEHFTNRGMLDGKFPSVTFSKEKRKIIVLDDREIKIQLTGIMNDLAKIGCLTVLSKCVDDLNNVAVVDKAYSIAKELVDILDKYNFEQVMDSVGTQPVVKLLKYTDKDLQTCLDTSYAKNMEDRNKVIDTILSVDQRDLIINLHDNYDQIKTEEMDVDDECCERKEKELVYPHQFLEIFRKSNYLLTAEDKKMNAGYIHNLDGLLDEMLSV